MNPFSDFWQFLIGTSGDYKAIGTWRYLFVALFVILIVASIVVAVRNWREDPSQRTGRDLSMWLVRVLVGGMWFQGMLWKMPFPVSEGFEFWTEQIADRAAFAFHRQLATEVLLPNLKILDPLVFLAELAFAVSLILGLGVRLIGVVGGLYVLHLWLGIYQAGDPAEWPWSYVFLAALMFLFAVFAAGRSLGLDAWLRRHVAQVRDRSSLLGRLFHAVG
ncbi:MAG TPA: DoxX family protein [Xanthobacteraceae bacterium]